MLHEEQLRSASAIKEIPGANDIINSLRNHPDWKPAIATGGWHDWAVYKLKCTDLLFPEIPIATSDDAPTRRMIVQHSIERACRQYGVSKFEKMVAIGDNIWDVKTAKLLNLPFIGVGNRDLLLQEGTGTVIDNYLDQQQFMDGLNNAGVPR